MDPKPITGSYLLRKMLHQWAVTERTVTLYEGENGARWKCLLHAYLALAPDATEIEHFVCVRADSAVW